MQAPAAQQVTGIILAGGRGRRMGGMDKGLMEFAGRPLVEHIMESLRPQVGALMINANRNQETYRGYDLPVINDQLDDYQGPLAGFSAAMKAATTPWILTVPCDSPEIPADLLQRMTSALENDQAELAVAHDGKRLQPVYALLPGSLLPSLTAFLSAGDRKIDLWYARHRMARADFSDCPEVFNNINTPEQRERMVNG